MEARKKILIVEDEEDVRVGLSRILTRGGYDVDQASNGREALERVREAGWYDLIVLDVLMPVQDGYQTLDELRESGYEKIPVILLTAKFSTVDVAKGHDRGAGIYMRKPFDPIELMNAVHYLIGESNKAGAASGAY
ncbi:MAG: response regulator transcription factor [Planctomycetes bacterium]|nr:response regulator transcription factor [Planctomycetota bacterium]